MKTKEEPIARKEEIETMQKKLDELTSEELAQVAGGTGTPEFENDKLRLRTAFGLFRDYLEDYKLTSQFPGRIQRAMDEIDEIDLLIRTCETYRDYIVFNGNWAICKSYLKGAEAEEAFSNRWYLQIQTAMDKALR